MRSTLTALALFLCTVPALAADHLAPGDGSGAGESPVLQDVFSSGIEVFAIVEPPFAQPYAVGMRVRSGEYRIFSLAVRKEFWPRFLKDQSANASHVCEMPIPSDLGARIDAIWAAMLRAAGPDAEQNAGIDSAHYTFAKVLDGQLSTGSEWDRDGDSKVGMLQAIAVDMQTLCESPGAFERERFVSRVDTLTAQLQQAPEEKSP